jgi:single-strand DNA-binding protein
MLEMNKVMLIGNLTREPEVSFIQNGTPLGKFGLAVGRSYKDKSGQWKEETDFVEIEAWRHTAEFAGKYLHKGTRVYVEGRLRFSQWQTETGEKRSKLSVTADKVDFALPKSQQDAANPPAQKKPFDAYQRPAEGDPGPQTQPAPPDDSGDLPF